MYPRTEGIGIDSLVESGNGTTPRAIFGSGDYRTVVPPTAVKHTSPFRFFSKKIRRPSFVLSIHEPQIKFGVKEEKDSPQRL